MPIAAPTMPFSASGRVGDAVGAELGLQALGDAEHAAVQADVLAEHDHARILAERRAERVLDRLNHGHRGHRGSPGGTADGEPIGARRPRQPPAAWADAARGP
jgi:hypothetical protein